MERIFSDRAGFNSASSADRNSGAHWNHHAKLRQNHLLRRYRARLRNYHYRTMLFFPDGRNSESKYGRYGAHWRKDYLVVWIITLTGLLKLTKSWEFVNSDNVLGRFYWQNWQKTDFLSILSKNRRKTCDLRKNNGRTLTKSKKIYGFVLDILFLHCKLANMPMLYSASTKSEH